MEIPLTLATNLKMQMSCIIQAPDAPKSLDISSCLQICLQQHSLSLYQDSKFGFFFCMQDGITYRLVSIKIEAGMNGFFISVVILTLVQGKRWRFALCGLLLSGIYQKSDSGEGHPVGEEGVFAWLLPSATQRIGKDKKVIC